MSIGFFVSLNQQIGQMMDKAMNNWYKNMPKGQKIFVYFISTALVVVYGIGLIPLTALIYLKLGQRANSE